MIMEWMYEICFKPEKSFSKISKKLLVLYTEQNWLMVDFGFMLLPCFF